MKTNRTRSSFTWTAAFAGKENVRSAKSLTLTAMLGLTLILAMTPAALSQARSKTLPVHPIPSAPKRSYVPASFSAMPGLQCKLYPEGTQASKGLTIFTDDDGYARFHAVRATASSTVQRLALDCKNPDGKSYSYSVDLTSDDTFAPRPLNLQNERGTDRPALNGDPLSYTQSELIQAGYGLRPDPKDTAAYARWLEAASTPGRMLETSRSISTGQTHAPVRSQAVAGSNSVTKITGPPWVGSTLNGAPNYVAIEATFNVPSAVALGDETTAGTQIAIWDGVEGPTSALIQGGVALQTLGLAATYSSWREYCCGDGASNKGAYNTAHGAFTPNPGDKIYDVEWYCDANGNLDLTAGYGCSFVDDETTGAVLNCVLANGSPCPSVPAIAGWVVGHDADFVIEDQTSQLFAGWLATTAYTPGQIAVYNNPYKCLKANTNKEPDTHPGYWQPYPIGTAFTDFTPEVTMTGSAYTSTTNSYSSTVSTDPVVDVLVDFTNTTSHMNVSIGTTDETYFASSQFKQVAGHADYTGTAESIAVGPNAEGSNVGDAWILGEHPDSNGNYAIYQWKNSTWVEQPGRATHIAISPQGYPWVTNNAGEIFYWDGSAFNLAPGNGCASWIGVGPNAYGSTYGDPWILGCTIKGAGGYDIYQLQGSTWVNQPGQATKLAVGPRGPWVINAAGNLYYWKGTGFVQVPGACATSVAVGPLTAPFAGTYGDVWTTGCSLRGNGYRIWQFVFGETWEEVPGIAAQISVSPDFGVPWIVNTLGDIYQ